MLNSVLRHLAYATTVVSLSLALTACGSSSSGDKPPSSASRDIISQAVNAGDMAQARSVVDHEGMGLHVSLIL